MKILITKADGTAVKSKLSALAWMKKHEISKELLIEENGQFFYEVKDEEIGGQQVVRAEQKLADFTKLLTKETKEELNWETPVFTGKENTKLSFKKNIDVDVILVAKHPAGQSASRPYNAIEVKVGNANSLILPVDLAQNLFEVEV